MFRTSSRPLTLGTAMVCAVLAQAHAVHAEDFLSALFGGFGGGRPQAPATPLPYASESGASQPQDELSRPHINDAPRPRVVTFGGSQAFCVRSCDGRYFPVNGPDRQSKVESCESFCPASKTVMVFGSHIDSATTETGKTYAELPNAFRYRNEFVAGCTCNGKDQIGLASVKIENDPTLRKGDLVAGADGLMVATQVGDRRGASLNASPVSRPAHVPVVAAE